MKEKPLSCLLKSDIHTSWAATLSELADSNIKPFNSTHDKVFASCFLARSWRFLFSRSFTFSGGRECGYDTPEKARKEPVNLGSSIGGMLLKWNSIRAAYNPAYKKQIWLWSANTPKHYQMSSAILFAPWVTSTSGRSIRQKLLYVCLKNVSLTFIRHEEREWFGEFTDIFNCYFQRLGDCLSNWIVGVFNACKEQKSLKMTNTYSTFLERF